MGRDFTTNYFIGNYICSLIIFYIYGLVSDSPLFFLFYLYQYPLLLIHLFSQIQGFWSCFATHLVYPGPSV